MDKQANDIVEKIHRSNIGLKKHEIERIVRETVKQIEEKEMEELGKSVAGTD